MATRLILIRHGQTEWNRIERFRGRADVPLNQTGLDQADMTGLRVAANWKPVAIYSSPLSRSLKTGEAVALYVARTYGDLLDVQAHLGLADIDYGEWQGLTPEEARQRWPEEIECWYTRPEKAQIPGGETLDDLRKRGLLAVQELTARHPEETIVLVGHTVINRVILLAILGLGNERFWHIRQDNCAINVFEAEQGDYTLVSLNETAHLRIMEKHTSVQIHA